MHFVEKEPSQKRADFVSKLKSNKILRVPGAYNPLTAKLIEEIGYDAVYVSGGVMANDLGFPDIGLTTLQDVSTRSYLISRVTSLPTIVDIDTGFKSCEETATLARGVRRRTHRPSCRMRAAGSRARGTGRRGSAAQLRPKRSRWRLPSPRRACQWRTR